MNSRWCSWGSQGVHVTLGFGGLGSPLACRGTSKGLHPVGMSHQRYLYNHRVHSMKTASVIPIPMSITGNFPSLIVPQFAAGNICIPPMHIPQSDTASGVSPQPTMATTIGVHAILPAPSGSSLAALSPQPQGLASLKCPLMDKFSHAFPWTVPIQAPRLAPSCIYSLCPGTQVEEILFLSVSA